MWIAFSLLAAFADSLRNLLSKKKTQDIDLLLVSFAIFFFALPLFLVALLIEGIPTIGKNYVWALFIHTCSDFVAYLLLTKALQISPISLISPLLAFSSIGALATAPFLVGDLPRLLGILGVVVIFIGTYLLNLAPETKGFIAPLKALLKEKGAVYAIVVACMWGITNSFAKIAVENSSAYFHCFIQNALVSFLFALFIVYKRKTKSFIVLGEHITSLLPLGLLAGFAVLLELLAYTSPGGQIAYVVSLKRLSLLLGVLYGATIFKEKHALSRLFASLVIFIGVVLIVWGG